MLKIEHLTKTYSGSQKPSVDDVSFEVADGEIFGFIGPNGAGKSTTIKCIAGIISMSQGEIYVNGKSLRSDPLGAKRNIGYVSDDHTLYEGLTGIEYVNFIADVFGIGAAERKQRLERLLELFSLQDSIKKQISTYSHGMKQKLNVIGALIHEPKLWILDEPMTGLDPKSAYNLKQLMREHAAKGNSVFFSSHVLEVVEKVCDRIAIIDDGHLVAVCTLDELKQRNADKSLEELFLKLTDDAFSKQLYSGEATVDDAIEQKPELDDKNMAEQSVQAAEQGATEQKSEADENSATEQIIEAGDAIEQKVDGGEDGAQI